MISGDLQTWFLQNKRDLPWRNTQNPYFIWLSEIILQQTKVAQGMPYYLKFIENFPTIYTLAAANQDAVLQLWQGLGYYSRARNMHNTAINIVNNHNGRFPASFSELIIHKGIGTYTASAIASFAYNEPVAVLDGNVMRVLSRLFAIEEDINKETTKKILQQLANDILPIANANTHNQAMMEFGALQCVPKNPNCDICPLHTNCMAFAQKKVSILPFKSKKTKPKQRQLHYYIYVCQNKVLMHKRPEGDIWQGLFDFFEIPNEQSVAKMELQQQDLPQNGTLLLSETVKHVLTHQILHITFSIIKINFFTQNFVDKNNLVILSYQNVCKVGKPIVIHNFLEKHKQLIFN